MDLGMTAKVKPLVEKVRAMVRDEIMPLEHEYEAEVGKGDRWTYTKRQEEIREGLKAKARERGLWNFWLTASDKGYGLTTVEYAYLAEEMGWSRSGTGDLQLRRPRHRQHGSDRALRQPRAEGDVAEAPARRQDPLRLHHDRAWRRLIRRHQPRAGVPSSMATSGCSTARSGSPPAPAIRAARSTSSWCAPIRRRRASTRKHSQIFVPAGTKGVEILRPMKVYGDDDAPHGHMHIRFTDVRVPKENLILGRGRGFEVSQGRLGPGRIHHCMRAIGQSERALELLCRRSLSREAFGKPLAQLGANYDIIAESRMKIEMARLLCLKAAYMMDTVGQRDASPWISQIKVIAPRIALEITDEAVQMHGAMGITQDTPLAHMWTHLRTLRLADGPDAVHRRQVARAELKQYTNQKI